MMRDVLIKVAGVSKKFSSKLKTSMKYGIIDIATDFFGAPTNSNKLRKNEFWGVRNVSLEVRRGECLGLIGPNGAGKSTLLKMLNGIIMPDKGAIEVRGRVGALIEVGAGFHPLLTGRENIYINGSIMGLKKKEIDRQFDSIVEFSELGEFIDTPVSYYSSGMYVRLGFAIAAHLEPDVLLIDEVLAVGDFWFRQKCAKRINEITKKASVILVSHSMRDITMLCPKAIVINKGKAAFQGASEDAADFYLNIVNLEGAAKLSENKDKSPTRRTACGEITQNSEKITNVKHRWVTESGEPVRAIEHGATIILEFSFKLLKPVNKLVIGVPIFKNGSMINASNTDAENISINIQQDGTVTGKLIIENIIFNPGTYESALAVMDAKEYLYRGVIEDFLIKEMPFYFGIVTLKSNWHFDS